MRYIDILDLADIFRNATVLDKKKMFPYKLGSNNEYDLVFVTNWFENYIRYQKSKDQFPRKEDILLETSSAFDADKALLDMAIRLLKQWLLTWYKIK